jgi:phosphoribosylglycinamide formyltransferase 1
MRKIKLALIASGSGTDADSIMKAHADGFTPNVEIVGLISTKENAGCLQKALLRNIPAYLVSYKNSERISGRSDFDDRMKDALKILQAELVFLVGCIHRIPMIPSIRIYNIHPAEPHDHGGDGMYGSKVHEHVLERIKDQIKRGLQGPSTRFFTYPTVHEVSLEYDRGETLLSAAIEIPQEMVNSYIAGNHPGDQIAKLQKLVLKYEWIMLPAAVRMAAEKLLDEIAYRKY